MCKTLYFYFCIPYSVLTTKNLVSIHHRTVEALYPFCPLPYPVPSGNYCSVLCICVFVCFWILFYLFIFIQQVLISYLFYTHQCIHVNPNLPIHHNTTTRPLPLSPLGVHTFVLYICVSISALQTGSSVPSVCLFLFGLVCSFILFVCDSTGWKKPTRKLYFFPSSFIDIQHCLRCIT